MKYDGKFTSKWRAKSPDALCAVSPLIHVGARAAQYKGNAAPGFTPCLPKLLFHKFGGIFSKTKKGLLSCDLCGELRILRRIHFLAVPEKPPYSPCGFSGFLKSWKNFKATPHKDCATDASPNFSSNETKSGVNT